MYKELNSVGSLRYSDFIRKSGWGINLDDEFYPLELTTSDNNRYFIIGNENKELFHYDKKGGFRSFNTDRIRDIALDSQNNSLYLVQNGFIKKLELNGTLIDYDNPNVNKVLPCEGLTIDQNSNFYVLKKDKFVIFENEEKAILECEDYCTIEADNLKEAIKKYEDSFAEWKRNN